MIEDASLLKLVKKIKSMTGMDFGRYREGAFQRRVQARLRRVGVGSIDEYIQLLDSRREECSELIKAVTINVTEFFRNPESFDVISKVVIPNIIASKRKHHHWIIKIWSCGCATGDEVYSVAILLHELLGKKINKFSISIFGTDINHDVLDKARSMVYDKNRLKALDEEIVDKYFKEVSDGKFKLKDELKDMVKFELHDIIEGAHHHHCDLIMCRNLLIYFDRELQEDIVRKFYDCLNPGGYLVLGMTEGLSGDACNLFESIDNRLRIYKRSEKDEGAKGAVVLSQEEIDKIVAEMMEK